MEPLTPAMRDAMAQVRLTSRRLRAMAAAQHDEMVRVLALGLPPGVVPGEARPPGAMRLLRPA
ncbi:MAG: hypothetical protein QOC64_3299, partial [Solirubrobacteraceae bacterium]|nr:hypothetical protein [Solirubrobacteraceae bacterium]